MTVTTKPFIRILSVSTCTFLCIAFSYFARAQATDAAFRHNLQTATTDSAKLSAYDKMFRYHDLADPDSGVYYLKIGLAEFRKHNFKQGIASMLIKLSSVYASQGFYDLAEKTGLEGLAVSTGIKNDKSIANGQNSLGVMEGRKGNFPKATEHFLIALKIFETIHDTEGIINTYLKLGAVNDFTNNTAKALEYFRKGLDLCAGRVTYNTIYLYNNIGSAFCRAGQFDTAAVYLQKALDLSKDKPMLAHVRLLSFTNLGLLYNSIGNTPKAMENYRQALELTEQEKLPEDRARLLINMSYVVAETDKAKALKLLDEALGTSTKFGQKVLRSDALIAMIDIYKSQGNFKEAFALLRQQGALSDSIFSVDKTRAIANMETAHDLENANSRLKSMELLEREHVQKRELSIFVAIFLGICLVVVIFFFLKTRKLNMLLAAQKAELTKANNIKDKLFSIIGHDLMGSVSNIPVGIQLYRGGDLSPEEKDPLLNMLEKNAMASLQTLENLLNWGKAQIKGITLNPSSFNVNAQMQEELRLVNIAAAAKEVHIFNNMPESVTAYADENHFKFIIRNLLHNAVKYSYQGGKIQISADAASRPGYIVFSVNDNGIGISEHQKEHLFEPYNISVAGTANETGNGIGLLLCKEFVRENGGDIWVTSTLGKGTTFYFTLKAHI